MESKHISADTPSGRMPGKPGEFLSKIDSPADLRLLDVSQLPQVCREVRQYIIDQVSHNPGHFASSMGAVEIATALHYVFDTPEDRIVWDVGHQAYAHKILTGRRDSFPTLRTKGGISGFPKPSESEYDSFTAGHASNSISAALGMAIADLNTPGREKRHTVAVIGDASISGGLAFEGLNNASNNPNNLLIILNDNDMSIDKNVGALHRYLSEMTTSRGYNNLRHKLFSLVKSKGLVTEKGRGRILRFNNSIKSMVSRQQNIFEGLNIRYFGPFDGNDVGKVVQVLNEIKDMTGPRILHLCTKKGKGFEAAERDPSTWHAPGLFDPQTGERIRKNADNTAVPALWQEVFGQTLVELAEENENVMAITAAMPSGTSVSHMLKRFPNRTFDVGISEGHAVTFAGGLAASGKRPFVAIYSSFLQRAYDNIIHDVAIQGLPVTFCIDRAGIVGEDGVTHHGLYDLAYLSVVPGLYIASPMDEATLRSLMRKALTLDSPFAIRYPRGKAVCADWKQPIADIDTGKGRLVYRAKQPSNKAVLTIGPVGNDAVNAAQSLEEKGLAPDVYDMIWLRPLDTALLSEIAEKYDEVVTVEDGTVKGGLGDAVRDFFAGLCSAGRKAPEVTKLGSPAEKWVHSGTVSELKADCGYDVAGIARTVESLVLKHNQLSAS